MPQVTSYPPGSFCWVDFTTPDPEKAERFYAGLFGWKAERIPLGDAAYYSLMHKNGREVAAIAPLPPALRVAGAPSVWNSYVSTEDVKATSERVKELGGKILAGPMEVMGEGRMAVAADPDGAVFMLWEAVKRIGSGIMNEPGTLAWNELMASNAEVSKEFYTKLFGWTCRQDKLPDGRDYHLFENAGRPAAGMMQITPEMGAVRPCWMVYFAVENINLAIGQAQELGGKKEFGPFTIPGTGTLAMIHDAVDAHFYLLQMAMKPEILES